MTRVAPLANGVLAPAHQVADRLVGAVGHPHRRELAHARQPRKLHRVAPVGLDSLAARARNRRRRHHLAAPAQAREVALQREPARASFIHDVQLVSQTNQPAHRLGDRRRSPGYSCHVAHFAVSRGLGQRDVDALLVNVQTDVQNPRFIHGPSP
jgi:hypothetical protein